MACVGVPGGVSSLSTLHELVDQLPESAWPEALETLQGLTSHYNEIDRTLATSKPHPEPKIVTATVINEKSKP